MGLILGGIAALIVFGLGSTVSGAVEEIDDIAVDAQGQLDEAEAGLREYIDEVADDVSTLSGEQIFEALGISNDELTEFLDAAEEQGLLSEATQDAAASFLDGTG